MIQKVIFDCEVDFDQYIEVLIADHAWLWTNDTYLEK
jgi:hypothetical protein